MVVQVPVMSQGTPTHTPRRRTSRRRPSTRAPKPATHPSGAIIQRHHREKRPRRHVDISRPLTLFSSPRVHSPSSPLLRLPPRRGSARARHHGRRPADDRVREVRQGFEPQRRQERGRAEIRPAPIAQARRAHQRGPGLAPRRAPPGAAREAGADRERDRGRRGDVQAASVPAHRDHGEHMRLLPGRAGFRFRVLHAVVHRVRADVHARDSRAVRPVRPSARARGSAAEARAQRGQGGVHPHGRDVHELARGGAFYTNVFHPSLGFNT